MKKQTGFSLVELVIVIIVVGLLAVAALPRFLNVTDEAKKASIEGVAGGYATAVLSVRAQWEAYGRPKSDNRNMVNYDGTDIYLTQAEDANNPSVGYPIALTNKAVAALSATDCVALMDNLLQNPPKVTSDSSEAQGGKYLFFASLTQENNQNACRYYQLASASSNGGGNSDVTSGHYFTYQPAKGLVQTVIR
ncbi:prepilin-type N-terminal cleavage/methylation domain-containing protein [Photobacterium ganghwense]|uniref:MSHA biogenesis protein MshB n=1 Tax=Photobacterium ganghwense TaxID=320778 RepID=A0A0J1H3P6_9GAMM|nr:prepilin-type N-terminal cleavage/methylation domain-containing protein [Photobacterium ganghwense]KLV06408.1 MSHA biogenesis protein MshB [Photobacterium ganghwense]MBV1840180.1 prepilin-type N-terminal cleavage/methylation domain-containing protein [Photobacterium ganghwense]PSU06771.1 prepilin-type N-terminal cleavage/methylation domain-containing protein [Photobacterium ganghwense]QSV14384.1 prepilin-type N-terminal cleavage/methylation domain-containing protein [Photobacterium ganghwens